MFSGTAEEASEPLLEGDSDVSADVLLREECELSPSESLMFSGTAEEASEPLLEGDSDVSADVLLREECELSPSELLDPSSVDSSPPRTEAWSSVDSSPLA